MRVRSLRHTVDVQSLSGTTTADSRGLSRKAFATVETIQAAIIPLSGREMTIARQIAATATHRVECHYTSTITPRSRFKYGTRYLNIESIQNVGERDRWIECLCTEEAT